MGDLDPPEHADARRTRRRQGGRVRDAEHDLRRLRPDRELPRDACGARARADRRRPDAGRGEVLSLPLALDRRRRSHLPQSRRDRGTAQARPGAALRSRAARRRRARRGARQGDAPGRAARNQRGDRRRRGAAVPRSREPVLQRRRGRPPPVAGAYLMATSAAAGRQTATGTSVMTNVEAVRSTLHAALVRDDRVLILGEDVGARGNVFLITKGFLEEFGPRRIVDTPLAEASIVGVAIGMAMEGLRPIAEIQFADFIYPAFNQIVGEAAKTRYRSNGEYTCPLVIRTPYGGGVRGALSHSVSIEALFYHVPGLKILAPSTPADIKGLLNAAIEDPDPVLFLEHKKTYRSVKADVKKQGSQLTVVSFGYNVHQALDAARRLEEEGLSAEVIDLRSIRPMDRTTILESLRKTRKLLIIHEDNKFGGVGAEISAMVVEEAFFDLDAPIRRLCGPDVPAMGYAHALEDEFMISTDRMAQAMRDMIAF